jgi:hypothetical protein
MVMEASQARGRELGKDLPSQPGQDIVVDLADDLLHLRHRLGPYDPGSRSGLVPRRVATSS